MWTVRVHFVQSVATPVASLSSRTVVAPASIKEMIVPLFTARHRHTHIGAHGSGAFVDR
jgi:hypothetical protein